MHREELAAQYASLIESRRDVELSREEYVELFDIGPIACFILDANGVIQRSNVAGGQLLESAVARLRCCPLLVFVVERDRRIWLEHMRRCRRSESVSSELTIRTRSGAEILVELTSRAFSTRRDGRDRYYTSAVDLRDRQRSELERRRVSEERRRIEQDRALARAESESKDRFIAILSHELRTPLTPILLATATWKDDATLSNPLRQALAMIHRNITMEARLIDDLLDLTRITQNKLVVRIADAALHGVIDDVVQSLQAEIDAAGLTLNLDLQARGAVRADPIRLSQIIWNLIRNAIRFTDPGGRITVETRDTTPATTMVAVVDTGIGFAPEAREHFFEAFDQGPEGTRRGGLGLGLAIAKGLVDAHGGTITASSDGLGTGARFAFDLPTSDERPASIAPALETASPPATSQSRAPLTVLLVEDHEDSAIALSYVLQQYGYAVQLAHSVTQALSDGRHMRRRRGRERRRSPRRERPRSPTHAADAETGARHRAHRLRPARGRRPEPRRRLRAPPHQAGRSPGARRRHREPAADERVNRGSPHSRAARQVIGDREIRETPHRRLGHGTHRRGTITPERMGPRVAANRRRRAPARAIPATATVAPINGSSSCAARGRRA